MTRLSHPSWDDNQNNIRWALQILKLLVMEFSGVSRYVPPVRPKNIFLSIPFSDTLTLWSSLHVTDQISYPHTATRHNNRLYVLNSMYLQSKLEDRLCCAEGSSYSLYLIRSSFLPARNFHLWGSWIWIYNYTYTFIAKHDGQTPKILRPIIRQVSGVPTRPIRSASLKIYGYSTVPLTP
jgi:hypothetical protein